MNDIVIVGGGPAGLSAAVVATSEGLKVCLLEAAAVLGGQAKYSSMIENYLGFPKGISGYDLAMRSADQAVKFGTEILLSRPARKVENLNGMFWVYTSDTDACKGKTLLITAGLQWRKLSIKGDHCETEGCGVQYGATPQEAKSFRNQHVIIVGAANSAGQAAMHFSKFAKHITLISREPRLTAMSQYLIERLSATRNIDIFYNSEVQEIITLNGAKTVRVTHGELKADAVFVFIGSEPVTNWIHPLCQCDEKGFIKCDENNQTHTPGIFVAGDIRSGSVKRVATSVGDGARVIPFVHKYLKVAA